ncbi:AfsR/SARP family transcriptional regulator [Labedaea rhizosphaerae]|uniref:DNA-binding SARP family transcriptional activator n=1 Tax=Labedaea rhizosphaerae TaxID=598644 RepID=A0A4R6S0I2_LABRH|nr:AfsR/SARP family transcriptional regulator [Labedaea rhizosphaerae]TDP92950.1 DNA-binding SARP family transcriptional activator [Labedaea rhizosphaerae]
MKFRILGPLEITGPLGPVALPPRQRVVLATLLLEPNRLVMVDRLVEAVWDAEPPSTARDQIRICISAIRRSLAAAGLADSIVTRSPGYSIRCADDELDLLAFDKLVTAGRKMLALRQESAAVDQFEQALRLWRGAPLAGAGRVVESGAVVLAERRLTVLEECVDLKLRLGDEHELVGELAEVVAANPFRERLRAQLMTCLYRTGRRVEALDVFRIGRELFVEALGLEPGDELRGLQRMILAGTTEADARPARPVAAPAAVPRLLPAPAGDFTGRGEQLAKARQRLQESPIGQGVRVVLLSGRAWSGKTTLAVHLAHSMCDTFTDGQLFVPLGGTTGRLIEPVDALDRFLRAMGVAADAVPDSVDECAEMYRNLLSDRKVLVVLDDAADERQVRPLLPGSPSCAVLVTSRAPMTALPGASRIEVGRLPGAESVALLTKVIGVERVRGQAKDLRRLAELCGGEPFTLRLAGARLDARPDWSVRTLIERLTDERRLPKELSHVAGDAVGAISQSYDGLAPFARRLLRRLTLLGSVRFSGRICAPLLDADEVQAEDALDELVDAGLLDVVRVTGDPAPFRLTGLVRAFARSRLTVEDRPTERVAALRRVLDHPHECLPVERWLLTASLRRTLALSS